MYVSVSSPLPFFSYQASPRSSYRAVFKSLSKWSRFSVPPLLHTCFGNNGTDCCSCRFLARIQSGDPQKALAACTSRSTINVGPSSVIILQDLSRTSLHCFHQSVSSPMGSPMGGQFALLAASRSHCLVSLPTTQQQAWAPPHGTTPCSGLWPQTPIAISAWPVREPRCLWREWPERERMPWPQLGIQGPVRGKKVGLWENLLRTESIFRKKARRGREPQGKANTTLSPSWAFLGEASPFHRKC